MSNLPPQDHKSRYHCQFLTGTALQLEAIQNPILKSRVRVSEEEGEEENGGLGPEHEVDADPNPAADDEGRAERRRGVDAAAEGGVQGADRVHADEQVERQRLVPDLRHQSRGHPLDRQVLVRPQPPQVRVRPPVRHPRHLPLHRPRARASSARRQDPEGLNNEILILFSHYCFQFFFLFIFCNLILF